MSKTIFRIAILIASCTMLTACGSSGIGFGGIVGLLVLCAVIYFCGGGLAGWRIEYRYRRQRKPLTETLHFYWGWTDNLAIKLEEKGGKYLDPAPIERYSTYSIISLIVGVIIVIVGGLIQGGTLIVILGLFLCAIGGVLAELTGRVANTEEEEEVQNMTYGAFLVYFIADSLVATIGLPFILLIVMGQNKNKTNEQAEEAETEVEPEVNNESKQTIETNQMPNYTIDYRYPSGSATKTGQCTMYSKQAPTRNEALAYIKSKGFGENYGKMEIVCIRFGTGLSPWVDENHPNNLLNK